jgi:hypothetical protein
LSKEEGKHVVAYEHRDPNWIFVAIPNKRGHYFKTDKSVGIIACPVCNALIGEPCYSRVTEEIRYISTVHAARRREAKRGVVTAPIDIDILAVETQQTELVGYITKDRYYTLKQNIKLPGSAMIIDGKRQMNVQAEVSPNLTDLHKVPIYVVRA